jgi:hypothetical protein
MGSLKVCRFRSGGGGRQYPGSRRHFSGGRRQEAGGRRQEESVNLKFVREKGWGESVERGDEC